MPPLLLLSRHLTTATSSAATWQLLLSHSPPPPLETALSLSLPSPPPSSVVSSVVSSPLSSSHPLLSLRFFLWASLRPSAASLSAAAGSLRLHLVPDLLDSYLADGSPVSLRTFKTLLSLSHHSDLPFPLALSFFRRMPQFGLRPDVPAFNSLLRLPSTPPLAAASLLLDDMKSAGLRPDLASYVTVIKKLCSDKKLSQARELVEAMKADGCSPNVVVYSALLDGACGAGDADAAGEILREMGRPNVVSYTCLMKCLCEKGRLEEAVEVLKTMGREGVRPNRVAMKTVIRGFCSEGRVEDACRVIEGLAGEERGGLVNECYSLLVVSLLEAGDGEGAEGAMRRMVGWGVRPDGLACNFFLREICKRRRYLDGYGWIGKLEEKGLSVDSDVYSKVLSGLCEEGHLAEAVELGRRAVECEVRVADSCAGRVVEAMEEIGEGELASKLRRGEKEDDSLSAC